MTYNEVFKACGLDIRRPLKDTQEVYERTSMKDECRELKERKQNILNILATFVSLFAPMTFGNNLCPDLVVMNIDGKNIIYRLQKTQSPELERTKRSCWNPYQRRQWQTGTVQRDGREQP